MNLIQASPGPVCSRYTYNKDDAKLKLREQLEIFGVVPRADIRPTDIGPVILPEHDSFACVEMSWGWRVPWDKGPLINAKSETLTTLPTFKPHLNTRCLILADGFFEKGVLFRCKSEPTFCMAGLWRNESDGLRYTMLTTTPNETVAPYHNRMPFILPVELYAEWLTGDWQKALGSPDRSPLAMVKKQGELF